MSVLASEGRGNLQKAAHYTGQVGLFEREGALPAPRSKSPCPLHQVWNGALWWTTSPTPLDFAKRLDCTATV
jgi:hypothetical protein